MSKFTRLLVLTVTTCLLFSSCSVSGNPSSGISITASSDASEAAEWLGERLNDSDKTEYILGIDTDAEDYGLDLSGLRDEGYMIRKSDGIALIFGKTADGLDRGVRRYANYYIDSEVADYVYGEGFSVKRLTVSGADITEFKIVCPDYADECMQFAASELQAYIELACGVRLDIVSESESYALTLELDPTAETTRELGDESFRIKSHENGITITGGRFRGCMYGVYSFLENYIGVKFYFDPNSHNKSWSTDDKLAYVYEAEHINIPSDFIDTEEHPAIAMRYSYSSNERYNSPAMGSNTVYINNSKYGGYGLMSQPCHGFQNYFTADELLSDWNSGYKVGIQPCFSNPDIIDELTTRVFADIENRVASGQVPGKDFTLIDVSHLDIQSFCTCSTCTDIYAEENAVSGTVVRLGNHIAEALEEDYPELYVGVFAYAGTCKPPSVTKPHKMLMIAFCFYIDNGYFCCSNHSLGNKSCPVNTYFSDYFDQWQELTNNIYVWYYPFECYYLNNSSANNFIIYDNLRYLIDSNIYGLFVYYCLYPGNHDFIGSYMSQRMMWNGDMTFEEFCDEMKEFLYLVFGDGYEYVYEYLVFLENVGNKDNCWCGFHSNPLDKLDLKLYKDNLEYVFALWENARKYACTADQEYAVDTMFMHARYYRAIVTHTDMWINGTPEQRAEYKENLDIFATESRARQIPIFTDNPDQISSAQIFAPAVEDIDYDINPFKWMPTLSGDEWSLDLDF